MEFGLSNFNFFLNFLNGSSFFFSSFIVRFPSFSSSSSFSSASASSSSSSFSSEVRSKILILRYSCRDDSLNLFLSRYSDWSQTQGEPPQASLWYWASQPGMKIFQIFSTTNSSYLGRMKSIVEDVEEDRKTEGSPAKSQSCENCRGCDFVRNSRRVNQSDGLINIHHQQDIDCQANIANILW